MGSIISYLRKKIFQEKSRNGGSNIETTTLKSYDIITLNNPEEFNSYINDIADLTYDLKH